MITLQLTNEDASKPEFEQLMKGIERYNAFKLSKRLKITITKGYNNTEIKLENL